MMYLSETAPRFKLLQRAVLTLMYFFVPATIIYVWAALPPCRLYSGKLAARQGLLLSPGVWTALQRGAD